MDFQSLSDNLGLELGEFLELVELFIETAITDLNRLESAFSENNIENVKEAAHSLKGSSGNLGFMEFSGVAKLIEEAARKNSVADLDKNISSLKEKMTVIEQAFAKTKNK